MSNNMSFARGVGAGLVVGMTVGMAVAPKKKKMNMVGKALRAAGDLADNVTGMINR